MSTGLAVTTTTTTEVTIKPAIKRKLRNELQVYGELKAQRDAIDLAMESHRKNVGAILVEAEEQSLTLEGVGKATMVFPVRKTLDKKLFVAQGGTLTQLENASPAKPGRPYVKISLPGEKEEVNE